MCVACRKRSSDVTVLSKWKAMPNRVSQTSILHRGKQSACGADGSGFSESMYIEGSRIVLSTDAPHVRPRETCGVLSCTYE